MTRIVPLALLALALSAKAAHAYPQFQFSTGTATCKECHFSPGGGGLINDYGRDEVSDLSMWQKGDGRFLHGLWSPPDSFQIGGDFRFVACCYKYTPDKGGETVIFPMQGEIYLRPKIGPVALYVTAGVMPARNNIYIPVSREHYLQYEKGSWYVKAGRYFPIYGIRSQDHTATIRRDLQMYIYEEPYTLSWGKYFQSAELHVSAFTRGYDTVYDYSVAKDNGLAVYYEKRNEDDTAAWAAQTKLTFSDTDRRAWVGGIYKKYLESKSLMLLGEVDAGVQAFPEVPGVGTPATLFESVGYVNATYFWKQGLFVGGTIGHFDPDLAHHGTSKNTLDLNLQWWPIPHVELHALERLEVEALNPGRPTFLSMLQVHYFL